MKHINRLLLKAKAMCKALFADNGDGFIDALGVCPDSVAIKKGNEVVGYDVMKALDEVAKTVWND